MARPKKQDVEKKMKEVKELSAKISPVTEDKKTVKRGRPKKADSSAEKTTVKVEKAAENRIYTVSEFVIQFEGNDYDIEQIKAKVDEAINSSKKRGVKSVGIYVQPKERVVYYSVNGKDGGKIEL